MNRGPTLSLGSTGADVRRLQTLLARGFLTSCKPFPGNVSVNLKMGERKPLLFGSAKNSHMRFTLGEAARQCGVAKGTISKAIANGKLSATRREDGSWSIDAAELARYLEVNRHRFRSETRAPDRLETEAATDALVAALRETIASLKQ